MANLRAAVLAAGRGIRMGGEVPKTLLPMGERGPLLEYILEGLKRAGVDDLMVVTGFRPDLVAAFVADKWGEATYVRNARYASWGNLHSVRVALDQSPGFDVLVVNSDIVVHPNVFRRVVDKSGDLVLAVERRLRLEPEDMRVQLQGDRLRAIGKDLKKSFSHGEFCGVSLLRSDAHRAYTEIATEWQWRGETQGYYEDVYGRMFGRVDARAANVEPGEYAEVDEPGDVPNASAVIESAYGAAPANPGEAES